MLEFELKYISVVAHLLRIYGLQEEVFHDEDGKERPILPSNKHITEAGIIAIIFAVMIVTVAFICCLVKRYCWSKQESATVDITVQQVCFQSQNAPEISWCTYSGNQPPPPYPTLEFLEPPRYSMIFDERGHEITPANT